MKRTFYMPLEDWNTILQFASAVLLGLTFAVGAGAIFTGYLIGKQQEEHIAATGRDAAEAHKKAAEAGEGTAKALAEAATANARAAEANRIAEGERLARIKIEERLAWRLLNPEQQSRIASKLSGFKGNRVDVGASPVTVEAGRFAKQIQEVLARAGWTSDLTKGPMDLVASGIVVRTTTDPRGVMIGLAVVDALNAEHFSAGFQADLPGAVPQTKPDDPYLTRVLIVVGSKPYQ